MTLILGCGYLGSMVAKLHPKEKSLVLTTKSQESALRLKEDFPFVEVLDTQDLKKLESLIQTQDVLIITLAPKNRDAYESTYLETAQNIKAALFKNTSVKQIIYTSSTSVYGEYEGQLVSEEFPLNPKNTESRILAEAEQIYLDLQTEHRNVCILRLSEIYGSQRTILNRVKALIQTKAAGNGQNPTNMIHVEDAARAILFCLSHKLSGVYNLCDDDHFSRKELYDTVCQKYQLPSVQWDASIKPLHGGNRVINNYKIKKNGFSFKYPRRFI